MTRCEDPLVGGQSGGGTHNVAADGLQDGGGGRRPRRRVAGRLLTARDALLPASCCHWPHFLIFCFRNLTGPKTLGIKKVQYTESNKATNVR
jgi:hypothetical protein